jgi:NAD(P)H-dependent flavin oxidoreductase YrpB (nitropropane dioxygenase family)
MLNKFRFGRAFRRRRRGERAEKHKELICSAGFENAITTLIFTGRPLRVRRTPYIEDWNLNRQAEIKELTGKGKLPHEVELEKRPEIFLENRPWLLGYVSAVSLPLAFSRRLI